MIFFSLKPIRFQKPYRFVFILLLSLKTIAQIPAGSWRFHTDFSSAKGVEIVQNKVFCFTTNGIFYFDKIENKSFSLTKLDGLSDSEIAQIRYAKDSQILIIAYRNGNLDFVEFKNEILEKIQNIDFIKNTQSIQSSKVINQIEIRNSMAYLAADFGLIEFDLNKLEIRNTLQTPNVQGVAFARDSIFINTNNGILGTRFASNNNIQFIGNWRKVIDNQLFKPTIFPQNTLIKAPVELEMDENNKTWIADGLNGLISNFEGNFKTYNPNGIVGAVEKLYSQKNRIYAIGERFNYFENNTWNLSNQNPNLSDEIIDKFGLRWQISNRGVVVIDDKTNRNRQFSAGRGAGNLPNSIVNSITQDREGLIWIGTNDGVAVIPTSSNILTNSTEAYTPVYQRRRLLLQENVFKIAVDGGNRKWIGTRNGLFLFNTTADELIEHFTIENTPIPSNLIQNIAIEPQSGEIFVLTDKGLISYRSDATEPAESFDAVKIFPNPVRPNFSGVLTITGLMENSTIKITDSAGRLMHQAQSNGGTATWDLTYQGKAAQTGIYLIFSISEDGLEKFVGKVAVVR
jgi:hypothetical protein